MHDGHLNEISWRIGRQLNAIDYIRTFFSSTSCRICCTVFAFSCTSLSTAAAYAWHRQHSCMSHYIAVSFAGNLLQRAKSMHAGMAASMESKLSKANYHRQAVKSIDTNRLQ